MKTLILMRHGKSDWSGGTPDKDRPINGRGQLAATLMASWLKRGNLVPDMMLISTATRTRETAAWMRSVWDVEPAETFSDALYLAEPETILKVVRGQGGGDTVLVLGHNPGMETAVAMAGGGSALSAMPTCGLAVFDFDIKGWADLAFQAGILRHAVTPKELV